MNGLAPELKNLKVILVHDWLTGMRGGERVLEILCRAFPEAPIYTLLHDRDAVSPEINSHPVITSWLQSVPGIFRHYRNFLPFFPSAIERLKTEGRFDLVISTSHCAAKGFIAPEGARHLCYCFTPMRYAWVFYGEYFGKNPVKKVILGPVLERLRRWDRESSSRVDRFATLSEHVRQRISDFYGRDADVVYPPVNLEYWKPDHDGCGESGAYDLVVSALVPYKRIDIAVRAYAQTGFPLKIAGTGTGLKKLRALAGKSVEFLGRVSDQQLLGLYRHCRALVFPGEEDFGLVPVEAQACGRPVVALARGGALETVIDGRTGILFREQSAEALAAALRECAGREWDSKAIRANAERFSEQKFLAGLSGSIRKCLGAGK